jgi:high-affinity nickel permease
MNTIKSICKSIYGLNMASSNKRLRIQVTMISLGHSGVVFLLTALITLAAGMAASVALITLAAGMAASVALAVLILSLAWGFSIIEAGRLHYPEASGGTEGDE